MVEIEKNPSLEKNENLLPFNWIQDEFKEKAFCIVWNQMKAKIEDLGLNEDDIANITFDNEVDSHLELIDLYFPQIQELKSILKEEYSEEHSRYRNHGDFQDMVDEETKRSLLAKLSYNISLKELFIKYDWIWQKVINKRYFRNFSYLVQYAESGEKYQFDSTLVIEFFELAEKIERNIKWWEDRYDVFDGICDAYENMYKIVPKAELFNDILRLCIAAWEKWCKNLLKELKDFDRKDDIKILQNNYSNIIKLWIIAGENNQKIFYFSFLSFYLNFLNWENKDLVIAWLEKLWPDFIWVLNGNSWFIQNVLERFPEQFMEFCENLKKLADYSKNNETFYTISLSSITQFIINYPNKWDYLLKIWEIFWKNSPWILSIWNNFINELIKHFPNNYEEILLEVRDIWEHVHWWNGWYFLTYWIKFLAKFLEEWKEKFIEAMEALKRINDDKLKQNHNTGWVFFNYGLAFVLRYMMHSPESKDWKWVEICEKIINIINKYYSNKKDDITNNFFTSYMLGMNQYIWYQIIDQDITLLDELLNFLEKVWWSKDSIRVINSLSEQSRINNRRINNIWNNALKKSSNTISFSLAYLLKYKKSKIIPFIKNLNLIKDLDLSININSILFWWVSLEYLPNTTLEEIFNWENVEETKIWKFFIKIWWQNNSQFEDVKRWISQIKQAKKVSKSSHIPYLLKIQNVFAESTLEYFEKTIHKKIHLKFRREFQLSKEFDDSLLNENLLEFYKMYSSTKINKQHAFDLIQRYLSGKVYDWSWNIYETYPYNRDENQEFLEHTLKDKAEIWLSRNDKVYNIEETENLEEKIDNIPERIAHHLKIANEKLKLLEVKDEKWNFIGFKTHWKLIDYFDTKLKKDKEKYDQNLFADLELQVHAIKDLLKTKNTKKVSKIKIYHELEPLKIAMMWKWVDNSCLSYYSTVWNYWSAITNALEVNKWVIYIEDENGNIIARVLVWIDNNWNLEIHPVYYKWNVWIDLKKYLDEYIDNLVSELWVTKHWDRDNVKILFCDDWYSWD